jgi:YVTN family beta-propeller protein
MSRSGILSPQRKHLPRGRVARRLCAGIGAVALVASLAPAMSNAGAAGTPATPVAHFSAVGSAADVPFGTLLLGPAPKSAQLPLDVVLRPRDAAALTKFALAVSTPGNALYKHFLPAGRFASVFGPSPAAIAKVLGTLRSLGLEPGTISSNHLIIPVRTTVARAEAAFGVALERYRLPTGRIAIANTDSPRLPTAAGRYVQAVVGLDNLVLAEPGTSGAPSVQHVATPRAAAAPGARSSAPHSPDATGPQPCAAAVSAGKSYTSWTENQLAKAYSLPTLYTRGDLGSGATIALYELSAYTASDISTYQSCYKTTTSISNVAVDGGTTNTGGEGEVELDIEVVVGLAPKAKIDVYEAPNSATGALDAYNEIVSKDTAQVMSSSWGLCEAFMGQSAAEAQNTIFEQAASQGQSMISIPGDEGSEGCLPNDFGTLAASIGKGSEPDGVAVDPSDNTAYIADFGAGTLSVVDELTLSVVKTINLDSGSEPFGVAVDPDTHEVFVTAQDEDGFAVIKGSTCNANKQTNCSFTGFGTGSDSFPEGIAVDPTTKTIYLAADGLDELEVWSESSLKEVGVVGAGTDPDGVAVDVTTNEIYWTAAGEDLVGFLPGKTCDASVTSGCSASHTGFDTGSDPTNVAVDAALARIYVSNTDGDSVSVLNAKTGAAIATVPVSPIVDEPIELAISPLGTALLVACASPSASGRPAGVAVISLSTDKLTSLLSAGSEPVGVASDPSTGSAIVSDFGGGAVVVIPLLLDPWDPGTQPFVTGVGGTDLTALGPKPTESVWDETLNSSSGEPAGAGGGGISIFWPMPSYQSGPGVVSDDSSGVPCGNTSGLCREVPDVSASADPYHGYVIYEQGSWSASGGTSAAAPLWAAITALLDVQQGTLHELGFLNPSLYKLVSDGKPIVNDVTSGNNDYTTTGGGLYPATTGYDMATGLGTPIGTGLSEYLGFEPAPTVTALSPKSGPAGGGTTVKITGTGLLWVSAVKFGSTAAKSFTIVSPKEVTAVSPKGTGTVTVTVTTPGGTSKASSGSKFTY